MITPALLASIVTQGFSIQGKGVKGRMTDGVVGEKIEASNVIMSAASAERRASRNVPGPVSAVEVTTTARLAEGLIAIRLSPGGRDALVPCRCVAARLRHSGRVILCPLAAGTLAGSPPSSRKTPILSTATPIAEPAAATPLAGPGRGVLVTIRGA